MAQRVPCAHIGARGFRGEVLFVGGASVLPVHCGWPSPSICPSTPCAEGRTCAWSAPMNRPQAAGVWTREASALCACICGRSNEVRFCVWKEGASLRLGAPNVVMQYAWNREQHHARAAQTEGPKFDRALRTWVSRLARPPQEQPAGGPCHVHPCLTGTGCSRLRGVPAWWGSPPTKHLLTHQRPPRSLATASRCHVVTCCAATRQPPLHPRVTAATHAESTNRWPQCITNADIHSAADSLLCSSHEVHER